MNDFIVSMELEVQNPILLFNSFQQNCPNPFLSSTKFPIKKSMKPYSIVNSLFARVLIIVRLVRLI